MAHKFFTMKRVAIPHLGQLGQGDGVHIKIGTRGDLLNKYLYLFGRVNMKHIEKTTHYLIGLEMVRYATIL